MRRVRDLEERLEDLEAKFEWLVQAFVRQAEEVSSGAPGPVTQVQRSGS